MTIPIYDSLNGTLPAISFPMKNKRKATKRYLGGEAMTRPAETTLSIIAKNDAQESAIDDFWRVDCNYGLEPFLIALPIFGKATDFTKPEILVRFVGDIEDSFDGHLWVTKRRIQILGSLDYIVDVNGDFIVSDTGEYIVTENGDYVPTGNHITSYRELTYGY